MHLKSVVLFWIFALCFTYISYLLPLDALEYSWLGLKGAEIFHIRRHYDLLERAWTFGKTVGFQILALPFFNDFLLRNWFWEQTVTLLRREGVLLNRVRSEMWEMASLITNSWDCCKDCVWYLCPLSTVLFIYRPEGCVQNFQWTWGSS